MLQNNSFEESAHIIVKRQSSPFTPLDLCETIDSDLVGQYLAIYESKQYISMLRFTMSREMKELNYLINFFDDVIKKNHILSISANLHNFHVDKFDMQYIIKELKQELAIKEKYELNKAVNVPLIGQSSKKIKI